MLKTVSSITNAIGALNYVGTWNASTNSPTITSSVGTKGDYYQVSVAGSTSINGISNWGVGDMIAFNGSTWQRIEGGADGNFVNLTANASVIGNTTAVTSVGSASASETVLNGVTANGGTYQVLYGGTDSQEGIWFNSGYFRVYNASGSGVYLINGATGWTAGSDERLKDIIEPIENASDKLAALRTVIGKYKTDEEGTRRLFLIAQDALAVQPELVSTGPEGYLGMCYQDAVPLLIAALNEHTATINNLKAEIATLKGV